MLEPSWLGLSKMDWTCPQSLPTGQPLSCLIIGVYFATSLHAWNFLLDAKYWQLYPVGWLYILYSYKYSWHALNAFKLIGNNLIILGMLLNYPQFLIKRTNVQIGTITCPLSLSYQKLKSSQDLNPDQYDSKVKCLYIMEC